MILFDTNIIVFAHDAKSPKCPIANKLVNEALDGKISVCITAQIMLEFYSVATSPKVARNPLAKKLALAIIESYWKSEKIKKISPSKNTFNRVIELLQNYEITQAEIFDAFLVATMEENNVKTIYTENISHFKKYNFLKVVNPFGPKFIKT